MAQETNMQMEESAFRELFDQYNKRVYGYVLAIAKSHIAAEELTQDIFIKLWLSAHLLQNVTNLDNYIFTLARNRTLNYLRAVANNDKLISELQSYLEPDYNRNNVDDHITSNEYHRILQETLSQLPPQQKRVYEYSRNKGMNTQEIALEMGIAPNTVKKHLTEALRFIRTKISLNKAAIVLAMFLIS
jgi:RNA polymerase sigma-70 factor (ECF subfamily)